MSATATEQRELSTAQVWFLHVVYADGHDYALLSVRRPQATSQSLFRHGLLVVDEATHKIELTDAGRVAMRTGRV